MTKFFLVGGAVRDLLLGLTPADYDYVVECSDFETLIKFCKDAGFLPLKDSGTESGYVEFPKTFGIKALCPILKTVVDIHCARSEYNYSDGAHPKEVKVGSLSEDADRRDFTCNQLLLERGCYDLDKIIDIHKGIQHIEEGILSCVGNPMERLSENPDRVIRAFRFGSRYGWDFDYALDEALRNDLIIEKVRKENDDRKLKSVNKILRDKNSYRQFFLYLSWYREMSEAIFSNIGLIASNKGEFQ